MHLTFTKMQGAGNDFVVIDARNGLPDGLLAPDCLARLADRRFGVGADQILLVERPAADEADQVDFVYRIFNADGHEVEQCGNGARCFARYVIDQGLAQGPEIRVKTAAGIITPRIQPTGEVQVDMGPPRLSAGDLPFEVDGLVNRRVGNQVLYCLETPWGDERWLAPVSMGNPHLVQWVEDLETHPVGREGAWLESHARLPRRVNAGFAQILSRHALALRVFERGAGETLACGTGACAAVVSGIAQGLLEANAPIAVTTRGGALSIQWSGQLQDSVWMTGPAAKVFEGEIDL